MKQQSSRKRAVLKALAVAGAGAVWHRPIVNSIVLPAHAQTSDGTAMSIVASSLDADNPFSRFILIVDDSDSVLANCGASGGTATAENLAAGTYRVFADSQGPQNHQVDITAGSNSLTVTVPTDIGTCNFLVATVSLPSGVITPASGQQISGSWSCSTNQGTGCN
jgi:hypothetical protein